MARLPQPGGDKGSWGDVLNDFLSQAHKPDGTLKDNSVTSNTIAPGAVTKTTVGLGNVDNTSDADKPISSATQTALDAKQASATLAADTASHVADSSALDAALSTKIEAAVGNAAPTFGQLADGISPAYYPTAKCEVTFSDFTFPGYDFLGPVYSDVAQLNAIAKWNGPLIWADPANHAVGVTVAEAGNGQPKTLDGEFIYTGKNILFWLYSPLTTQTVRVFIDDAEVEVGALPVGTGPTSTQPVVRLNFAERGTHRIRIVGMYYLIAVLSDQYSTVSSAERPEGIIISDSYFENNNDLLADGMAHILRSKSGILFRNFAQGATGYVNPGAGGPPGSSAYGSADRLARYAAVKDPKVIIVNGSINDISYPLVDLATAATQLMADLANIHPGVPVVMVGGEPLGHTRGANAFNLNAMLQSVAAAAPNVVKFIDSYNGQWLTGTGSIVNPTGDGNQDWMIASDDYHLTDEGGRHYGSLIWEGLKDAPSRIHKETP